ncbi:hypothetical protein ANCDUO_26941, partial [Ancylostoma duodenale]
GGGSEKENTPGGNQSFGERRGGFEAERGGGFGGSRGGTRGSGRGGRGFDRDPPRDGQRDRDSRDGFRGRGGYGGGNMRDSRSFEV